MKISEIITERLSRSFVEAKYGYWIDNNGRIHNINASQGHGQFLLSIYPGEPYEPYGENMHLYEKALNDGWIRIVCRHGDDEMSIQFWTLNRRAAQSLIDLIDGIEPRIFYYFDNVQSNFHTPQDAIRFVRMTLERSQ